MAKILIVEDHANTRLTLSAILRRDGHTVNEASTGQAAIQNLERDTYEIVITDLRLGEVDGIEVLSHVRRISPQTEVIVITAFGSVPSAVKAMKLGAFDYITKPLDRQKILSLVSQAVEKTRIHVHTQLASKDVSSSIVGQSEKMSEAISLAQEVALTDMPVLITGESGTGKELIANYIHRLSARSDKSFIAINCGALPESLQESELFGHVKGAFTGAISHKKGLFEEAAGGTVLLDEIGEMSISAQVKLLRALQGGEIRPVGGNKSIHVNVRVITSTNQDLMALVAAKKFREDLFYRINVVGIALPPLRDRQGDIPLLAHHFIRKYCMRFTKNISGISPNAMQRLETHSWLGNVRELENCVCRAVMLCKNDTIQMGDLEELKYSAFDLKSQKRLIEQEKALISETLRKTNWNQRLAAAELGIGLTTLWRKVKKFGLKNS